MPKHASRIAGLILAGGAARRLGGVDKPLLRLGALSLIEHLLGRLAPQVDRLAVSANGDLRRYAHLGLPVLADRRPGQGPLAGLEAGLLWAEREGADGLLSVPGDTPFVPTDLARRLAPPPAVAASRGRCHHAVALWPVSAGLALERWLEAGDSRAISAFARTLGMREVAFAAGARDPFFNINTQEELAEARSWSRGPRAAAPE